MNMNTGRLISSLILENPLHLQDIDAINGFIRETVYDIVKYDIIYQIVTSEHLDTLYHKVFSLQCVYEYHEPVKNLLELILLDITRIRNELIQQTEQII